jgi:hypothetical protein
MRLTAGIVIMKRTLFVLLASTAFGFNVEAASPPSCSMDGVDWRNDRVFAENRHPAIRHQRVEALTCRTTEVYEPLSSDMPLRVVRAKVYEPRSGVEGSPGIEQSVNIYTVSRVRPQGEQPVGRFLAAYDVSRDRPFIDPAVGVVDGEPVLTLGRNVATAYRITTGGIVPFDAHAWVAKATETLERNLVAGQVRLVDFTRMAGYLAVFPAGSDDPSRPGSERTDLNLVKAHLAFENGQLVVKSVERVHRNEVQDVEESAAIADIEEAFAAGRRRLPRGTEPCYLNAWSVDTDPAGLNVRAEPSERSRVLGRVPPAWTAPGRDGDAGTTYRSEFEIAGYRDGWFYIRKIKVPGEDYNELYPRSRPQPFRGQGWVAARLVGGALSIGGLPNGRLMQAPNAHAAYREVTRNGEPISTGDIVQRLYACSGNWALIDMEGVQGWWNTICSNQVTNCS